MLLSLLLLLLLILLLLLLLLLLLINVGIICGVGAAVCRREGVKPAAVDMKMSLKKAHRYEIQHKEDEAWPEMGMGEGPNL